MPGTGYQTKPPATSKTLTLSGLLYSSHPNYPKPETHNYFVVDRAITVEELAGLLGLEHNPIFAPFHGALYLESGEPGETYEPAGIVLHTEDECVFAVFSNNPGLIAKAEAFAEPWTPADE